MFTCIAIGLFLGYWIGRLPGAIIGGLLGWWLGRNIQRLLISGGLGAIQKQFLDSTFAIMGAVAKADGQVTQDEIQVAENLFDRLRLGESQRAAAKAAFNRGKQPEFDLDAEVTRFAQTVRGQRALTQMFLQVQLSAIAADAVIHPSEHDILVRIARGLGVSEAEVARLEAMLRGASERDKASQQQNLDNAYQVLGLASDASDAEVKKAYRKLMSENHPDKLASKGMPESMREMAEEKTREIGNAYETVKTERGMN